MQAKVLVTEYSPTYIPEGKYYPPSGLASIYDISTLSLLKSASEAEKKKSYHLLILEFPHYPTCHKLHQKS